VQDDAGFFKNDKRHSADPRKANTNRMILFRKAMTDEEITKRRARLTTSAHRLEASAFRVVRRSRYGAERRALLFQAVSFRPARGDNRDRFGMRHSIEGPRRTPSASRLRDPHS
jgi:hypothetical protein